MIFESISFANVLAIVNWANTKSFIKKMAKKSAIISIFFFCLKKKTKIACLHFEITSNRL